ncbi:hypothetical protein [Streptomyces sp. NPDC005322]|uniref:hypothetical protein n=1 Tax=Streptomyces sp. NPDC005322 TaxID=3157032 RepID=UPI0033B63424
MGIESEKLVYDYLSRVGDLAQQQGLSSGDRMRLVSGLRADIDHRRATGGTDTPAGVKRILAKLGSPAEVVAAAGGRPPAAGNGGEPGAHGSEPSRGGPGGSGGPGRSGGAGGAARAARARDKLAGLAERTGLTGKVPAPREGNAADAGSGATPSLIKPVPVTPTPPPPRSPAASPPHLAGEDELSPRESNPDWWHVDPGPFAQTEQRDAQYGFVEGFVGGVEIPELLGGGKTAEQERQERREAEERAAAEAAEAEAAEAADTGDGAASGRAGRAGWATGLGPVLLLSIALLIAGAALGNVILLAFGWVLAYSTRKLSRTEAKFAVMGMPGLVAAGGMVWLWGRANGRWGDPIPDDGMKDALTQTWPVVVRAAAVASVLFLLWRARRRG